MNACDFIVFKVTKMVRLYICYIWIARFIIIGPESYNHELPRMAYRRMDDSIIFEVRLDIYVTWVVWWQSGILPRSKVIDPCHLSIKETYHFNGSEQSNSGLFCLVDTMVVQNNSRVLLVAVCVVSIPRGLLRKCYKFSQSFNKVSAQRYFDAGLNGCLFTCA